MSPSPSKWKPGQEEPKYDDGNPDRINWTNAQSIRLSRFKWDRKKDTDQRGVILLTHGMDGHVRWNYLRHTTQHPETGELTFHELRYDGSLIEMLNNKGFDVFGLDSLSYGASDGYYNNKRSYFHRYEDLVDDIIGFTKAHVVPSREPDRPLSIIGVSFGGGMATHAMQREPELFSGGGVLLAPMLSVDQLKKNVPLNKLLLPIASFLSATVPTIPLSGYTPNLMYPLEEEAFKREPMCYGGKSMCRIGVECMRACDDVQANMSALVSSVLVIHDIADPMADVGGAVILRENAKSSDLTVQILNDGDRWHSYLHEIGMDKVKQDIVIWLMERSYGEPAYHLAQEAADKKSKRSFSRSTSKRHSNSRSSSRRQSEGRASIEAPYLLTAYSKTELRLSSVSNSTTERSSTPGSAKENKISKENEVESPEAPAVAVKPTRKLSLFSRVSLSRKHKTSTLSKRLSSGKKFGYPSR